jgi:hypothetical protein
MKKTESRHVKRLALGAAGGGREGGRGCRRCFREKRPPFALGDGRMDGWIEVSDGRSPSLTSGAGARWGPPGSLILY